MTFRRTGTNAIVSLGVAFLGVFWPETARGQIKLEYKFLEGTKQTYKTTSRVRQVLSFMNNVEKESILRETKVWTRSTGKRRADSTRPVLEKVESLRDEYTIPDGVKLVLDSSDPKLKITNPDVKFLNEVFQLQSALSYVVVLDDQANVRTIEGIEQLKEKAKKLGATIASEEFQNQIGIDKLKTKFEQGIHQFPHDTIRAGEPWERTEILEMNGISFTVRKKYDYRGTEKKGDKSLDKVGVQLLEVKYNQDSKSDLPLKVVKSDLKVESSEGIILFDREAGHIVTMTDKIRIKGNMTYSGAGVEQTVPFNLSLDANTQLQSTPQ